MIKGAQKKMVVVRTHDSKIFAEAYFVMRRDTSDGMRGDNDSDNGNGNDNDIVAEANRIIRQNTLGRQASEHALKPTSRVSRALCFCAGVLTGGGICAVIAVIAVIALIC